MNHSGDTSLAGFPVADVTTTMAGVRPYRTLAIVGSHPRGLENVPWDDSSVEIILFNEAAMKTEKYPRWDMLLQIHRPEVYASPENWVNRDHWDWLQQRHGKPIYMQAVDPRVPDSVAYPLDGVLSMVPYRYLRSSPAMALALAIYLGYQHIQLYGSELTSNTEYAYQAINYAFWIGFAHGRGVQLDLRCWQSEFNQPVYGFDGEFDIARSFFSGRRVEHERAWRTNENALEKLKSRLDNAMLAAKFDVVSKLLLELETAALVAGEASGAMAEAERYSQRQNPISRQEYEKTAARAQKEGDDLRCAMHHAGGKAEYVWNVWRQTGRIEALNQLRIFAREKLTAAYDTGSRLGIYRENILYMSEWDARIQAAGGLRAFGRKEEPYG